jgi:hypothetical protein
MKNSFPREDATNRMRVARFPAFFYNIANGSILSILGFNLSCIDSPSRPVGASPA